MKMWLICDLSSVLVCFLTASLLLDKSSIMEISNWEYP